MAEKRKQRDILSFFKKKKTDDAIPCTSSSETVMSRISDISPSTSEVPQQLKIKSDMANVVFDIASAVGKVLSKEEKYKYLKEHWIAPSNYEFSMKTEGGQKRRFQKKWLDDLPWLAYSQSEEGAFCVPCVLFGPEESGKKHAVRLGALVNEPLKKFKKALEAFKNHSATEYHKMSLLQSSNFTYTHENPTSAVNVLIDVEKQKTIAKNIERLLPIVKTVIFCGRENIPLRGHRDDGDLFKAEEKSEGKFRALLKFRIDAGDENLKGHLENAPKNATFISKTTQNELIECCHSLINKKFVEDVKEAKFFSILGDETTDVSTTEQLSLVIRYLDTKKGEINEKFLCFLPAVDLRGEAITQLILEELKKLGLSIESLRGQGYDGGANMAGKFRGVQALIKELQPLATYTHCSAHKLNLSLSKSCTVPSIRNMMGIVKNFSSYVHESCKRTELLKLAIQESHPEEKRLKIHSLSDTRWVERHDALLQFHDLFDAIVQFLEKVDEVAPSTNSAGLLAAITRFDFVMALTITSNVFQLTVILSRQLQAVQLDLNTCYLMVESVIDTLKLDRNEKYQDIYDEAVKIANSQGISIETPRIIKKQTHRANIDASDAKEYYRLNVYLPFMDFIISELSARFSKEEHSRILSLFKLIPSKLAEADISEVVQAAKIYEQDLPSPFSLKGEIALWQTYWSGKKKDVPLPSTAAEAYHEASEFFPNVKILLQILATIPVTTCSVERSFSALKLLKNYLRSTMGTERLNGLASMFINRSIILDPQEVIEEYAKKYPRRLELLYERKV